VLILKAAACKQNTRNPILNLLGILQVKLIDNPCMKGVDRYSECRELVEFQKQ
jgi:hypothetical protein